MKAPVKAALMSALASTLFLQAGGGQTQNIKERKLKIAFVT